MQHHRFIAGLGLTALVLGMAPLASTSASPASSTSDKLALAAERRVSHRSELDWLPPNSDPNRLIRVIVEVAGTSVAVAQGDANEAGVVFTAADEIRTENSARAAQTPVVNDIVARGGDVENRHIDAINALTVSLPAGEVRAISDRADVVNVTAVRTYTRDNANSNVFTNVAAAWETLGYTGAGVKVAIIDDGIDYTHADFGGTGTYEANDREVIETDTFPTVKVIGGYDFVGDAYDASSADPALTEPVPDDDPLACGEHGTHVAGTAAGQGVLADGTPYTGPYDSSVATTPFSVAPGSAPEASLLAYKVFGCDGSVDNAVLLSALDRAVADGADVINMSLGSTFGYADDPDAVAADNAAKAGVVVVVSAGNEGSSAYMVGGPSTGHRVISVAALDALQSFPGASVLGGTAPINAINANGASLAGVTGTADVIFTGTDVSLGCDPADFAAATSGSVMVIRRGVCARVDKALNAQDAGAIAVIMINNADSLPPFEGNVPGLTIPFIGVSALDAASIVALDGTIVSFADNGIVANPAYTLPADFTSGGPRSGDSGQKPDLIAPGVGVASAAVGTGTQAVNLSGTSMAAPHVAGIAALVVQAHPNWSSAEVKAALINTANAAAVGGYDARLAGNGLVNPVGAINVQSVMGSGEGETAVNFGFEELRGAFSEIEEIRLTNLSAQPLTYDLITAFTGPSLGAVTSVFPSRVTVRAGQSTEVRVRINLSRAATAALPRSDQGSGVVSIRGRVIATPTNGQPAITTPFLLVPHARSNIAVTSKRLRNSGAGAASGMLTLRNSGIVTGDADVYSLLLSDVANDESPKVDSRAVGVQYLPTSPASDDIVMVFAFSDFDRFSSAGEQYEDMYVDTNNDGTSDYEVFVADNGIIESNGAPNGNLSTYVRDLATDVVFITPALAPTDGSATLALVYASDIGLVAGSAPATIRLAYTGSWLDDSFDDYPGTASISPFDPQTSSGDFITLGVNASSPLAVTARAPKAGEVRALGWMIVTLDDASGRAQSDLVRL